MSLSALETIGVTKLVFLLQSILSDYYNIFFSEVDCYIMDQGGQNCPIVSC